MNEDRQRASRKVHHKTANSIASSGQDLRVRRPTSVSLPVPLLTWLDEEAKSHGMTRNSFVVFQLQLSRQTRHMERVRALEHRMSEVERKLVNGI